MPMTPKETADLLLLHASLIGGGNRATDRELAEVLELGAASIKLSGQQARPRAACMTPLEIEILMHYLWSTVDYRNGDFSAPAVRAAIDRFSKIDGMLKIDDSKRVTYVLTDRARAYLEAVQAVPLPVCVWVIPATPGEGR